MLPMLKRELVEKRQWVTNDEIIDFFTLGQCTPGVIAVNVATFVGVKNAKIKGAIAAALGMVFPPIVVITLLSFAMGELSQVEIIANALWGIRIAVCAMVTVTAVQIVKETVIDLPTLIIAIVGFSALIGGISPVIIIPAAAIAGVVVRIIGRKGG
ncbi:MAG: chromate transporter [Oscillospiraceae bacterium]|nr:chromate transporter [Oscillospiraceae bacterium]